jgi:glucose/arabinose dehydrogenase
MRAKRVLFALLFFLLSSTAFSQTFFDPDFISETAVVAGPSPMGVTWATDGRMFVWRKAGTVVVFSKDLSTSKTFLDISTRVNKVTDRGLVGFALDPDFATNGLFYVAYVYEPNGNPNDTSPKTERVSRFSVKATDATVGDPNSETVILGNITTPGCSGINQDCMPSDAAAEHTIDDLHFYGGKLFVSLGDGASEAVNDNAFRSQNLDILNGKILRVNTDGTGPSDNPFYNGDPNANRSKIYSLGLRNPFRFSIDQATGNLYIGDVGQNSWEEIDSGRGKNFGWPCFEGDGTESQYAGSTICQNLPASAVTKPVTTYAHTSVGGCIIGGPLYTGSTYPTTYRGSVFFADFTQEFIKRITYDASGNVTGVSTFATGVSQPVYLAQGPDGNLYYISIGAQLVKRIRYTGTANRPPVAAASANPTNGYAPLNVNFSSDGTSDPDGDTLTYSWNFGDGTTNASANPTHQYVANGPGVSKYDVVLTVKDPSGATATASLVITVGSTPPQPTIATPADGTKANVGDVINFSGSAFDPDDGNLPASALHWSVILHHETHTHDMLEVSGATSGSFTVQAHDTTADFFYEIKLTATDSSGLSASKSVFVYPIIVACSTPTSSTGVTICTPAPPSSGGVATVNSSFTIQAAGGSAVTFMEIWMDSTKVWQNSGNQTQTTVSNVGNHTITVYGRNSTGVVGSQRITITVGATGGGGGACTAGTSVINICAPSNGASVTSPVTVTAAASSAVTWIEIWLNSTKVWQGAPADSAAAMHGTSQSLTAASGTYTMTVYGRNNTGVVGSASINFTVTSGSGGGGTCTAPPPPPSSAGVSVCSPTSTAAPGSTMASPVRALASATVSGTFARMELWIDGVKVTTNRTSPTIDWTATLGSGSHRFTFYAVNTAGTLWKEVRYATVP